MFTWERGATDGTRSPHGEPKLSESELERGPGADPTEDPAEDPAQAPAAVHAPAAAGAPGAPRRAELGPLQLLFARLELEPDEAASLGALCEQALTRGQPELARRLIRQARATGRELPKELQALARRANATPSVLPPARAQHDPRSCCLAPVLLGVFALLGASLGVGVMALPDARNRMRLKRVRASLSTPSFAQRRLAASWMLDYGLRLAREVEPEQVAALSREAHAALSPGRLSRADAREALAALEDSRPHPNQEDSWAPADSAGSSPHWGPGWSEAVSTGLESDLPEVRRDSAALLAGRFREERKPWITALPELAWARAAEAYAARPELRALLLPLLVDERSLPDELISVRNSGPLLVPSLPSARTPEALRAHFQRHPRALLALLLEAYESGDAALREAALEESRWVLPRYQTQLGLGEWDPRLTGLILARLRRGGRDRAPKRKGVRWSTTAELALGLGLAEGVEAYLEQVRSSYERYKRRRLRRARGYARKARRYARSNPPRAVSLRQDERRAIHEARNPDSDWVQRQSRPLSRLPRETLLELRRSERNHGARVALEDALGGAW